MNITGTGMVAGVWDGGLVRETHELLAGKVANQTGQINTAVEPTGFDDHMTHVTGTMVGKDFSAVTGASANAISARGIAYSATAQNYDWVADKVEAAAFAAAGYLVSNHSYGYANDAKTDLWRFGAYDVEARAWDVITKNAPNYLPFVAVGNEQAKNGNTGQTATTGAGQGYDVITGSSAAKNVMTIGAVNGDKTMSTYSNWGPTDDGRLKPDLVAKGTGINSAQTASDTAYSGNGGASSGTSYATPAAAAAGLLLQQYFKSLNGNFMVASTLKALMINTAEDLGNAGPDVKFGWGLINVEAAATAIKKRSGVGNPTSTISTYSISKGAIIEEITVNPAVGSEMNRVFYAKGGEPIKATVCWTDDEGVEQTSADGVDPTAQRKVYSFGMIARNYASTSTGATYTDVGQWLTPGIGSPDALATRSTTGSNTVHPNNCIQVVTPTNPTAGYATQLNIRKITGSPSAARTVSLVVTGVAENAVTVTPVAVGLGANTITCNGSSSATVLASGSSASCTLSAGSGNYVVSVTGSPSTACSPTVTSGFTYNSGNVSADCTITATFAASTVGVCGAANNAASVTSPSANLCTTGTASTVASGATSFTWGCNGANGGTNASCTAPRQHVVTASAGTGGTLNCVSPVTAGGTTTCAAAPSAGFVTASISGCSGTATASGINAYATGAINADCTVSATFSAAVNATCGGANTVATVAAPSANLCSVGTASAVASAATSFTWGCTGTVGGGNASCAAPRQYTVTTASVPATAGSINCGTSPYVASATVNCTATPNAGFTFSGFSGDCTGTACSLAAATGDKSITANFAPLRTISGRTVPSNAPVTATFTTANGGASCRFDSANTGPVAPPAVYPTAGSSQPHGMFKVKMIGCTPGFTARLSVTWPSLGSVYAKYGRAPGSTANGFYAPSNLTLSGNTASFDVTDGGLGDDDQTVNSEITDPSGPVVVAAAVEAQVVPVPTLDGQALLALILLMLGAGWVMRKRAQR